MFGNAPSQLALAILFFFSTPAAQASVEDAAVTSAADTKIAAEPNTIDQDDDGHYERLPMEPANVKRVFLGFRLTTVSPGSIYEKAGLRAGDLLKTMNGKPVIEPDDLKELPKILDRDKKVELKIERGDKKMTLRYSVKTVTKVVPAPTKKTAAKAKGSKATKSKTAAKSAAAKRAASSAPKKTEKKKSEPPKKKSKLRTAEQDPSAPSEASADTRGAAGELF